MRGYHIHMITIQRTSHLKIHDILWSLCWIYLGWFDWFTLTAQKFQSLEVVHVGRGSFHFPCNFHWLLLWYSTLFWDFIIHLFDKITNWVRTNLTFHNIGEVIKLGTLHPLIIASTWNLRYSNGVTILSNGYGSHICLWRRAISVCIVPATVSSI